MKNIMMVSWIQMEILIFKIKKASFTVMTFGLHVFICEYSKQKIKLFNIAIITGKLYLLVMKVVFN